jgi:hypothetical protein
MPFRSTRSEAILRRVGVGVGEGEGREARWQGSREGCTRRQQGLAVDLEVQGGEKVEIPI